MGPLALALPLPLIVLQLAASEVALIGAAEEHCQRYLVGVAVVKLSVLASLVDGRRWTAFKRVCCNSLYHSHYPDAGVQAMVRSAGNEIRGGFFCVCVTKVKVA